MNPAKYDLAIYQGKTFTKTLLWQDSEGNPIDFTGAEVRMQIRPFVSSDTIMVSLTEANGRVTTDPENGEIVLTISATDTAALVRTVGSYDLEVEYADGTVDGLLYGNITISREVTR